MNIIQVYQTNPFEEGQGGGVRYLKNVMKYYFLVLENNIKNKIILNLFL